MLAYSFFGIMIYKNKNVSLTETIFLIDMFIETAIKKLHEPTCGEDNLLQKLLKLFNDVIFHYQFYFAIILALLLGIIKSMKFMHSSNLKSIFSCFLAACIIFVVGIILKKLNQKIDSGAVDEKVANINTRASKSAGKSIGQTNPVKAPPIISNSPTPQTPSTIQSINNPIVGASRSASVGERLNSGTLVKEFEPLTVEPQIVETDAIAKLGAGPPIVETDAIGKLVKTPDAIPISNVEVDASLVGTTSPASANTVGTNATSTSDIPKVEAKPMVDVVADLVSKNITETIASDPNAAINKQ